MPLQETGPGYRNEHPLDDPAAPADLLPDLEMGQVASVPRSWGEALELPEVPKRMVVVGEASDGEAAFDLASNNTGNDLSRFE